MTPHDAPMRPDIAHSARVYDYWLGGKDNFQVDRNLGDTIRKVVPDVPMMVRANRQWMHRVTRILVAEEGVRQFLDIGTGIPTRPNLHEVAQRVAPECRVVYVDNDPLVLVHARALLTSHPAGRCAYLDVDLRDPAKILTALESARTLDLSKPVAVTFASVLMLVGDSDDPWGIVQLLLDRMPEGSFVAISHPTADVDPEAMADVVTATAQAGLTFVPRSRADVERLFAGWEMTAPGLVPILAWRPDQPPEDPNAAYYWAGVARNDGSQRRTRQAR